MKCLLQPDVSDCNALLIPSFPYFLLPHLVLVALAHLAELPAELYVDFEVEVALVPFVWLHREVAAQLLALEQIICKQYLWYQTREGPI